MKDTKLGGGGGTKGKTQEDFSLKPAVSHSMEKSTIKHNG